jgi:uncharacterized protein YndB with AHSA1/START domain
VSSTQISRHVNAPRAAVYKALLDPRSVAVRKMPTGTACHVHEFDAREGGSLRISLTYEAPAETGKTSAHTDKYRGRFVKLVPNEQLVEVDEFETTNPAMHGEMTMTITITLPMQTAARMYTAWTTDYQAAFRPPTTSLDGGWRLRSSPRSSRRVEQSRAHGCRQFGLNSTSHGAQSR